MNQDFSNFFLKLKSLSSPEEIYHEIISFGKSSPYKTQWSFQESDRVVGCQSVLYVRCKLESGKLFFEFFSDALISQGLAALLVSFANGKTLKEFLLSPPTFFTELNMGHLLSAGRSNGVNSLYKKMIEIAVATCKEQ